jgi:hypothetical protein
MGLFRNFYMTSFIFQKDLPHWADGNIQGPEGRDSTFDLMAKAKPIQNLPEGLDCLSLMKYNPLQFVRSIYHTKFLLNFSLRHSLKLLACKHLANFNSSFDSWAWLRSSYFVSICSQLTDLDLRNCNYPGFQCNLSMFWITWSNTNYI